MKKLTRRKLLTEASVGAGIAGILVTGAACAPFDTTQASTSGYSGNNPQAPTEPLAVFVTDPASGTLVIMNGDRQITVTNASLAQSLLSLS